MTCGSASCAKNVKSNIDEAIVNYEQLEALAKSLPALEDTEESASVHLVEFLQGTAASARQAIFDSLASDIETILKQIGWPKSSAQIPTELQPKWKEQVDRLLELQKPELRRACDVNATKSSKEEPAILAPLEILARPLALRFQYHFSGDRMTNRIDKPEYFFNHVFDLINEYADFVQTNLQGLIVNHYKDGDLSIVPAYVDVMSAWITALLPMLQQKLQRILPQIVKQPNLFSNLVHEVMTFDTRLTEEWDYTPLSTSIAFRGLSHYILSDLDYFAAWFAIERDFALARYESIISDRSTGQIDYESVDSATTKPTKGAIRVNDLLETITDRYRTLSSFHQKMKFLIDIQIAVFDRFHGRLVEGLDAYITRTSTVGRTVHAVDSSDADLSGVKGLDRLCRIFGSAEYLEKAMRDWSEDTFFLDLWEELQYRSTHAGQIKGDLSMMEIASKTSSTINDQHDTADELQGALFDETAASYRRLRIRSEQVIVDTIDYELRNSLRSYARVNNWASMSATGTVASLTAELDGTVRTLDVYFEFLSKAMGKVALRRVLRQIGNKTQIYLWDNVLLRHSFSTAGAAQFAADVRGMWSVIDRHAGPSQGNRSMQRLGEGIKLLCLPVKGEIPIEAIHESDTGNAVPSSLGLWEVERRVFASNESAREVLEELGHETLSESDAREVLKRRVEIGS